MSLHREMVVGDFCHDDMCLYLSLCRNTRVVMMPCADGSVVVKFFEVHRFGNALYYNLDVAMPAQMHPGDLWQGYYRPGMVGPWDMLAYTTTQLMFTNRLLTGPAPPPPPPPPPPRSSVERAFDALKAATDVVLAYHNNGAPTAADYFNAIAGLHRKWHAFLNEVAKDSGRAFRELE